MKGLVGGPGPLPPPLKSGPEHLSKIAAYHVPTVQYYIIPPKPQNVQVLILG